MISKNNGSFPTASKPIGDTNPLEFYRRVESHPVSLTPFVVGFHFSSRTIIVLVSVRFFLQDPQAGVVAGLALNFLLLLIVFFQSIGTAQTRIRPMLGLQPMKWVLAFLCFSGCSLLWTGAVSLGAAAVFWTAMASDLGMVALLMRRGSIADISAALMRGYVWGACAVALSAWMLPPQSDLRLGDETLLGPNQIGYACAFALFFAQYLYRVRGRFWIAPAIFLGITLLRTLSKTSIVALVAAETFILFRDRSLGWRAKALMIGAAGCVVAAFSSLISAYFAIYTNAGSQAETLTGRFGIWAYFLDKALEQPWIGHGFHSVWKVVPPFSEDFEARHAHNELLQQFYAYGGVGVVLFFGLYGSLLHQIRKLPRGSLKTFFLGMLMFVLIRGLADTEPFDLSLPLWAVLLVCAIQSSAEPIPLPAMTTVQSSGFAAGQVPHSDRAGA